MFLARTVAHTTDWRAMLHQMEPRDFDEWLALYHVQPWGVELPTEEAQPKGSSLAAFQHLAGF